MGTDPVTAAAARRRPFGRLAMLGVAAALLAVACTPPATGTGPATTTPDPNAPWILGFNVRGPVRPAPAVVTLTWSVSDPDGDPLTCHVDGNGDGTFEITVANCENPGSRNVAIAQAGPVTAVLRVEDGNSTPVQGTRTFSVPAGPAEPMNIELRGVEQLDPQVANAFATAVSRWERIIVRGLPNSAPPPRPACLPADVDPLPAMIDDLLVDVAVEPIDGPGGILGQAGPTCVSLSTELGIHGVMTFDQADVAQMLANGSLTDVVTHELGHVLGFGVLWDMSWLPQGVRRMLSGGGGSNPTFIGPGAVAEWELLGRTGNVPVENSGGAGTRDSHWREVVFGDELMTGYISYVANPLSRVSIASMADLGYHVDLGAADPYVLPGTSLMRRMQVAAVEGEMLRPVPGAL